MSHFREKSIPAIQATSMTYFAIAAAKVTASITCTQ